MLVTMTTRNPGTLDIECSCSKPILSNVVDCCKSTALTFVDDAVRAKITSYLQVQAGDVVWDRRSETKKNRSWSCTLWSWPWSWSRTLWSWSCKQRSWSWSCYFGLGLKNLVLFTSLVQADEMDKDPVYCSGRNIHSSNTQERFWQEVYLQWMHVFYDRLNLDGKRCRPIRRMLFLSFTITLPPLASQYNTQCSEKEKGYSYEQHND